MLSEEERFMELCMEIVGRGDDEIKWPPGTHIIDAVRAEVARLKELVRVRGEALEAIAKATGIGIAAK